MVLRQVRKFSALKPEAVSLLKAAMEDLGLSARAHDNSLHEARTIADVEGHDDIKPQNSECSGLWTPVASACRSQYGDPGSIRDGFEAEEMRP
jgi:Magnesium chelatase, subunit ChlI C-terminal